jgi:hypothetical protein
MRWRIQLPNGVFLDTPIELELQFELNNQVFSGSSTSALPGSYSFPVQIPLTPLMRKQLNHLERIDTVTRVRSIPGACAYAEGVKMFPGTLKIFEVDSFSVKISLISNPVASLKEKTLPQLDLEGPRVVAPTAWADYMKDTADNPEDYDHAFFYVFNDNGNPVFNLWDDIAEEFTLIDASVVTPFIRLNYLLERMFLQTGYQFVNNWQSTSLELNRLYVFNNADARVINTALPTALILPDEFELNKHLPPINQAEFLKKLVAQWGLGLFTNIFEHSISLTPLKDILARAPKHDWTEYALYNPSIIVDDGNIPPGYYNYPQPTQIPPYAPPVEDATIYNTTTDINADLPVPVGYYYIETNSNYIQFRDPAFGDRLALCHRGVRVGSGPDYESGMEGLFEFISGCLWDGPYSGWIDNDGFKWEQTNFPCALMFYRGLQDCIVGANKSTLNGNSVWLDGIGAPDEKAKLTAGGVVLGEASQSLNWFGPYGLYENYHRTWSEMLRNNKPVKQTFHIPIQTLTSFSFEDKIRVGNMVYFVKSLGIRKLLHDGLVQVEASMLSIM